ncbi:hypothetical protein CDD83_1475 [Cordyceps sp. RAO-2017]|nr:hypothetical protein CDD83_1475 [Cordyceps sp. RAO-2017]
MATTPAAALDPGDNNAHLLYIPSAVFTVLCPTIVALRLWARLRPGGKMGPDDWTAIAALIFTLLHNGILVACKYQDKLHPSTPRRSPCPSCRLPSPFSPDHVFV